MTYFSDGYEEIFSKKEAVLLKMNRQSYYFVRDSKKMNTITNNRDSKKLSITIQYFEFFAL